jgi:hypothetical protein
MSPLRLTQEEYELLDSAIDVLKKKEGGFEEKLKTIAEKFPDKELDTWAIVMDSGDVLEYEEMEPRLEKRSCDNNCAAACRISCVTGCKNSCQDACKGSCKTGCGNAYRVAAGQ